MPDTTIDPDLATRPAILGGSLLQGSALKNPEKELICSLDPDFHPPSPEPLVSNSWAD